MRFMTIYKPGRDDDGPPTEKEMAAVGKLIEEMAKDGTLLSTDGLQPSKHGSRVRINADGKFTVTDGPFTETKELVGGYAIINVKSRDEAVELTKRFLSAMGHGESEIRLMQDAPAFDRNSPREFSGSTAGH
jgi:hypothetical protein